MVFPFILGLVTGLAPLVALPLGLALPAVFFFQLWERVSFPKMVLWMDGAALGLTVVYGIYPWAEWQTEMTSSGLIGKMPILDPFSFESFRRMFLVSDFDLAYNPYAAAPFYWGFLAFCAARCRTSQTARFALSVVLAHGLFSMSQYPAVLFPIVVLGACL